MMIMMMMMTMTTTTMMKMKIGNNTHGLERGKKGEKRNNQAPLFLSSNKNREKNIHEYT